MGQHFEEKDESKKIICDREIFTCLAQVFPNHVSLRWNGTHIWLSLLSLILGSSGLWVSPSLILRIHKEYFTLSLNQGFLAHTVAALLQFSCSSFLRAICYPSKVRMPYLHPLMLASTRPVPVFAPVVSTSLLEAAVSYFWYSLLVLWKDRF